MRQVSLPTEPGDNDLTERSLADLNTFGNEGNPYACVPREPGVVEQAFAVAEAAAEPNSRGRGRIVVGPAADIPIGGRVIVDDGKVGIGVFNIGGTFRAIKNSCPHQGAELCRGPVGSTLGPSDAQQFRQALDGRVLQVSVARVGVRPCHR